MKGLLTMWIAPAMMLGAGKMIGSTAGCSTASTKKTKRKKSKRYKFVTSGGEPIQAKFGRKKTIAETAVEAGTFKTLVSLLKAADLVEFLQGEGPFTVFAPTDDAFDQLPPGTVPSLLKDAGQLSGILRYHVIGGRYKAADLAPLDSAETLAEKTLGIDSREGLKVNDARVIKQDVKCSNGVIHVIDGVLIPE